MINSLFMLGASYNKNRKISLAFIIGWVTYMIIRNQFALGNMFVLINAIIFLVVCIFINLIKNEKINTILSISSILIWSILIDIVCYFMYPQMTFGQNIIGYVWQGILFNYKYIFSNVFAIVFIYSFDLMLNKFEIEKNKRVLKEIF